MAIMSFGSCSYLDIIPDNVATLDHAFADETTAERYLFTCYAGLPKEHNGNTDPAMAGSYEFWQKILIQKLMPPLLRLLLELKTGSKILTILM